MYELIRAEVAQLARHILVVLDACEAHQQVWLTTDLQVLRYLALGAHVKQPLLIPIRLTHEVVVTVFELEAFRGSHANLGFR